MGGRKGSNPKLCLHPVFLFGRSRELAANSFLLLTPIKFLFPSDQIFLSLVPLAVICSPPGKLQLQDLPGKTGRDAISFSTVVWASELLCTSRSSVLIPAWQAGDKEGSLEGWGCPMSSYPEEFELSRVTWA